MLVLTRKLDESIIINDDIVIKIIEIGHSSVKIGVQAPNHIGVYREEIYSVIKKAQEEKAASETSATTDAVAAAKS